MASLSSKVELLEQVGEGRSAKVYKARMNDTGDIVAVKQVPLALDMDSSQVLEELNKLHESDHEGIVEFKGSFYEDGKLSIVMEFMDMLSLKDLMCGDRTLPEQAIGKIATKILGALDYLHGTRHLIHRDIKPSNILVNSAGQVKLADFGVCGKLKDSLSKARTFLGSTAYMSPERITGHPYTFVSDIWSLGLVLLECALGKFPYKSKEDTIYKLMDEVVRSPTPATCLDQSDFSEEFQDFMKECLDKNQEDRPTAEELLGHPFIEDSSQAEVDLLAVFQSL